MFLVIDLPWPPSINHYYMRTRTRVIIGSKGIAYRRLVIYKCKSFANSFSADKRLRVTIECFPPDRRKRDLDNLGKCALDSLQNARVFADDNQIDDLRFIRRPELLGKLLVHIDII